MERNELDAKIKMLDGVPCDGHDGYDTSFGIRPEFVQQCSAERQPTERHRCIRWTDRRAVGIVPVWNPDNSQRIYELDRIKRAVARTPHVD